MSITAVFTFISLGIALLSTIKVLQDATDRRWKNKCAAIDAALRFVAKVDPNQSFYLNEVIHEEKKNGRRLVVWADGTREVFNN